MRIKDKDGDVDKRHYPHGKVGKKENILPLKSRGKNYYRHVKDKKYSLKKHTYSSASEYIKNTLPAVSRKANQSGVSENRNA